MTKNGEDETPAAQGEPDDERRRPGPHGAFAYSPGEEEAIARAYRRAERETRRSFTEICPRPVTAAEAVTGVDDQEDDAEKKRLDLTKSRACFVATAAYGHPDAPEVAQLRRFRDERLLTNPVGTLLVRLYYRMSPPFARMIARRPRWRTAVRRTLDTIHKSAASIL